LHHWEEGSGYGLVVGDHPEQPTVILPPLPLMAFTFQDSIFVADDFADFLKGFPETREALSGGKITPCDCLENLKTRGLLLDADEPRIEHSLSSDREFFDEGIPPLHSLYIYGTKRCNCRCYHCYQSIDFQKTETALLNKDEIPTGQIINLFDLLIPLGLRSVKLTGGEPFLRVDTPELIEEASNRGLSVSIESNGTNITPSIARILARTKSQTSISLDGSTAERHDRLRSKKGSFSMAMEAIRNIVAAGGNLKVITAVAKRNIDDLENIATLLSSLGVHGWKINPVNVLGADGHSSMPDDMLNAQEIHNLFSRLMGENIKERHALSLFLEGPPAFFDLKQIAEAGCGTCPFLNVMGLLSDGRISFCGIGYSEKSLIFGHISSDDVTELWKTNPVLKAARQEIPDSIEGVCSECVFLHSCCGSCRAIAYQQEKSFTSPHPWCSELEQAGLFPEHFRSRRAKS
jgi:SynChlorMet cassette radical SAM/SPASM protein ScmF